MEKYDLLIIGAGPGGYVAALEATKRGMNLRKQRVHSDKSIAACLHDL